MVEFWANYCRPCDATAKHIASLARHYRSGPHSRVKFYHVQLDAPENRSLNARLPFKAIPLTYFYYTGTGRVPTRTAPLLEGAIEGAFPEDAYIWRIEAILRRHGRSGTELLINQPIVRAWMWQAYRESRMGGFIPSASLPEDVSEKYRANWRFEENGLHGMNTGA